MKLLSPNYSLESTFHLRALRTLLLLNLFADFAIIPNDPTIITTLSAVCILHPIDMRNVGKSIIDYLKWHSNDRPHLWSPRGSHLAYLKYTLRWSIRYDLAWNIIMNLENILESIYTIQVRCGGFLYKLKHQIQWRCCSEDRRRSALWN